MGSSAAPPTPRFPPAPPRLSTPTDPEVVARRARERSRIAGQFGRKATILTGSRGVSTPPTLVSPILTPPAMTTTRSR